MAFTPEIQPITETPEELRAILEDPAAELPPLLPALAYQLGDLSLLADDLRPDPGLLLEEQAGWTPEQLQRCREIALAAFERLRACETRSEPVSSEQLHHIMSWICGVDLQGSYVDMLEEELSPDNRDMRATRWSKSDLAPDRPFNVAIVGAGMSGILAAHRFQQSGTNYVVLERNDGIGGTWLDNTYPGCRVDVSNHVYCYSFMQRHDWPQFHSTQDVLLQYFNDCADSFGVRDNIRFSTEVTSVVWDDQANVWNLEIVGPEGESMIQANAVVSAVGQLGRPKLPDIAGRQDWQGPWFHSGRWDHDVDLTNKRVGVIGSGCSALQFIPAVAEQAAHTTVFQRTPNWLIPRPQNKHELPENLMWLFTRVPQYNNWFRLRAFWRSHEGLLPACAVDPEWQDPGDYSVSAMNHELGNMMRMYLNAEFADRPDLLEKVSPQYPMGAKRFVVDDGTWARTLKRDDVTLWTEGIGHITSDGVVASDGTAHDFDVIIFATGFHASEFLMPMKVVGRGGADLHETWAGDARAYLGVMSPGFPNLFYCYGPNTNIVINGSIIYFSECEVHFITQAVRELLSSGAAAIDVKPDVHDAYNERIDAGNLLMAWGSSDVSSWYKSASGRVAQNWPFSMLEFWEQTRNVDPDDYEFIT